MKRERPHAASSIPERPLTTDPCWAFLALVTMQRPDADPAAAARRLIGTPRAHLQDRSRVSTVTMMWYATFEEERMVSWDGDTIIRIAKPTAAGVADGLVNRLAVTCTWPSDGPPNAAMAAIAVRTLLASAHADDQAFGHLLRDRCAPLAGQSAQALATTSAAWRRGDAHALTEAEDILTLTAGSPVDMQPLVDHAVTRIAAGDTAWADILARMGAVSGEAP